MNKPTTEQRIQEFMLVNQKVKPMPKQYECYVALDGKLYGHNIQHLSERQMIEGYDNVWKFNREGVKIVIATNSAKVTQDMAKFFVICLYEGRISTISIDLEKMVSERK